MSFADHLVSFVTHNASPFTIIYHHYHFNTILNTPTNTEFYEVYVLKLNFMEINLDYIRKFLLRARDIHQNTCPRLVHKFRSKLFTQKTK